MANDLADLWTACAKLVRPTQQLPRQVETLRRLGVARAGHLTYMYNSLRHLSRCTSLMSVPRCPLKFEVIFRVQGVISPCWRTCDTALVMNRRQAILQFRQYVAASPLLKADRKYSDLGEPLLKQANVFDFAKLAKAELDPLGWDYLDEGAVRHVPQRTWIHRQGEPFALQRNSLRELS